MKEIKLYRVKYWSKRLKKECYMFKFCFVDYKGNMNVIKVDNLTNEVYGRLCRYWEENKLLTIDETENV